METVSFKATDGFLLTGLWAVPTAGFIGTIILNPATGIKKEYYKNFILYLVKNSYRVLVFDYRGIGESSPKSLKGFNASMHQWATLDMNGALNYVLKEKNATTVIWMGHSIGAQLMGVLEQRHKIQKVIAINASIGYWKFFKAPYNLICLALWLFIGPLLTTIYGYAPMHKIGWGEPLPSGVFYEWRSWCLNKNHFLSYLQKAFGFNNFEDFKAPITAITATDDYIANKKTIDRLLHFYPNAENKTIFINPKNYNFKAIGHTGIFRRKYENAIWPLILGEIEN